MDVVANLLNLPFADESFAEAHAINPDGYDPVAKETWRVLQVDGLHYVTDTPRNRNAKPLAFATAQGFGFEFVQTLPILPIHLFGIQRMATNVPMTPRYSITTIYRRLP